MSISGKTKRIVREVQNFAGFGRNFRSQENRFLFERQTLALDSTGANDCEHPKVSALVLSSNRGDLLNRLFESYLRSEVCQSVEFLISLQDSTDDSEQILRYFSELLPIRILSPSENLSFSRATNLLAQESSGKLLLFLNNDFSFKEPVICAVANVVSRRKIGIGGISLCNSHGVMNQYGVNFQFDLKRKGIKPVNVDMPKASLGTAELVPAVTGAFLMSSKIDFFQLGCLDERFEYGLEDVDYCMRMLRHLGKPSVLLGQLSGDHPDQTSRKSIGVVQRRERGERNFAVFQEKHGYFLREALRGSYRPHLIPRSKKVVISAQATERDSRFGDSLVASFLKRRLQQFGVDVEIWNWKKSSAFSSSGFDYCLHLVQKSLRNVNRNAAAAVVPIAWVRQWGDRWSRDLMFLRLNWVGYSGRGFKNALEELGFSSRTDFCRLGADPAIHPKHCVGGVRDIDFLWAGNFFKVKRAIQNLRRIPGLSGVALGSGWNPRMLPAFELRESIAPELLHTLYRRSRIVVDESGANTGPDGSLNIRFWEALAAGALPLSNNELAVREIFGTKIPTWGDSGELENQIRLWSAQEEKRRNLVTQMRETAAPEHGLERAARKIFTVVDSLDALTRVCILNPARLRQESHWGDSFLANEFSNLLQDHGYVTRILPREHWDALGRLEAEIVITISGRERSVPSLGQVNVLWVVSNPNILDGNYLRLFDEVWVASDRSREIVKQRFGISAQVVVPAASPVFEPRSSLPGFAERTPIPLMIGNSIGRRRPTIEALLDSEYPFEVIGEGWEGIVPQERILSRSISRPDASAEYMMRRVILSDTRDSMREWGIFPPRVYEALRAGALPISDSVSGGDRRGESIPQWSSRPELLELLSVYTTQESEWQKRQTDIRAGLGSNIYLESHVEVTAERLRILRERASGY